MGRETYCSSVHWVVLALSFVQHVTCNVPDDHPWKNSAICFHVKDHFSFSSTSSPSSSGVHFNFGPRGLSAGADIPSWPTTLGATPRLRDLGDEFPWEWLRTVL
jgi:hypothetical protein